eukprot:CAMPEP_0119476898 /NCGR_PEP_ID=MMETSP1344-20130328/7245_1 /TAXON_ID=236787 /ORGANISM="Florenciella parvula, Strain CCMP2471" /LENGTH=49 /DNA_ID= /DNA_START= /DNA_END= /DNA_ORIENTATION=
MCIAAAASAAVTAATLEAMGPLDARRAEAHRGLDLPSALSMSNRWHPTE